MEFLVTQNWLDALALADATLTINGVPAKLDDYIGNNPTLVITTVNNELTEVYAQDASKPWSTKYLDFVISPDGKTATANPTSGNTYLYNELFITFVAGAPTTAEYTVDETLVNDLSVAECNGFINDIPVSLGDVYEYPFTFKVTPIDDNYQFTNGLTEQTLNVEVEPFTLDALDLSLELKTVEPVDPPSEGEPIKGSNLVYVLTSEQAKAMVNKNLVLPDVLTGEFIDYSEKVLGFIELPFSVDAKYITDLENIKLGNIEIDVQGTRLTVDKIRYNLGDINVVGDKLNLLDYANTTALLHLPHTDAVIIDLDYVINETVNVEYIVNLYDGTATVNVKSSKIDEVVHTSLVDLNVAIPFKNLTNYPSRNNPRDIVIGGDNGVLVPFIEVLRNNQILENGLFTIPVLDEKLLYDEKGFIRVNEIDLKSTATRDETDMIVNLLSQGVIIKW